MVVNGGYGPMVHGMGLYCCLIVDFMVNGGEWLMVVNGVHWVKCNAM